MAHSKALALAHKGDAREAGEALVASFDDPEAAVADWPAVIERLVKTARAESAEALARATIDAIQLRLPPEQAITHCGKIFRLFSKNAEFRDNAVELYKQVYEVEGLEQLIDISGLRGGKPVRRALQTINLCLAIQPGDYLVHKDEGPPAKVASIEPETWSVRIETPAGKELFDPVSLGDQYELAEANDFRVLQQFAPEDFAKKLNSKPADVVVTILKAHDNELTSDDLEQMLCPRYIPSGEWSKWWTKTRNALKRHPHVQLDGRNPVMIAFRDQAVAIEDDIWSGFDVHATPKAWLDLAQKYVRETKNRSVDQQPEFLLRLGDAMAKEAATLEQRKDNSAMSAYLAAEEVRRLAGADKGAADVVRLLEQTRCLRETFVALQADTFWPMALKHVKSTRPDDWPEAFADLMPIAAPMRCDVLASEIRQAGRGQLLGDIVERVLSDVIANVNGLCWLYQGPKDPDGMQIPPLATLVTRLLSVLEQVCHSSTIPADLSRDVRARIRASLGAKNCARFKQCLEQIDEGMADALCTRVRRSQGLSEAVRSDLVNCIHGRFPALWAKPQIKPWEDQQTLYCTEKGYGSKDAELDELVNVKMKENAIAIGNAAERGDLSENSEYKFALEERDLLRARVAEIQNQMAIAKVLHPDDVAGDHVGVGAKVQMKHKDSGRCVAFTFLGPWESDVDNDILNYQAPISQKMMGLKIGESVDIEYKGLAGGFEVLSIENGVP